VVAEQGKVLSVDETAIRAEIRERTAAQHRDLAETAKAAETARAVLSRDVPPRSRDRCGLHEVAEREVSTAGACGSFASRSTSSVIPPRLRGGWPAARPVGWGSSWPMRSPARSDFGIATWGGFDRRPGDNRRGVAKRGTPPGRLRRPPSPFGGRDRPSPPR
jgi:hypothetical protein